MKRAKRHARFAHPTENSGMVKRRAQRLNYRACMGWQMCCRKASVHGAHFSRVLKWQERRLMETVHGT